MKNGNSTNKHDRGHPNAITAKVTQVVAIAPGSQGTVTYRILLRRTWYLNHFLPIQSELTGTPSVITFILDEASLLLYFSFHGAHIWCYVA